MLIIIHSLVISASLTALESQNTTMRFVSEFVLLGFPGQREMQNFFFSFILVIYLLTLLGEWDYCLHSEMGQAASHTHVHLLGKLCLPRDLVHLLHCPKYAGQHPFRDQDHLLHWVLPSILLLFLTGYNGVFLLISHGL